MQCKFEACDKVAYSREFCKDHYYAARRSGQLQRLKPRDKETLPHVRFHERYSVCESGCWEWQASTDSHGYGLVYDERCRRVKAHRFSYRLFKGEIPEGYDVMHRCDNPPCVNPEHLVLGDHWDNMQDMVEKRRHAWGERNGHNKVSVEAIKDMRDSARNGETQASLAKRYGLNQATVCRIVNRKTWKLAG